MTIARNPVFVLDCPDPKALAEFYGALLDWEVKGDDGWWSVRAEYGHTIGFQKVEAVSYTHLRAHETVLDLVCRLLLEKKNNTKHNTEKQVQIQQQNHV